MQWGRQMVTDKGLLGYPSGEEGGEFTCKKDGGARG